MQKLDSKTRAEWFSFWKKRIDNAKAEHKKKVKEWADKILLEYAGETDRNMDTSEKYEQVAQVIMAVEETVQPHLFFQNPTVICKAKTQKWEKREALCKAVVQQEYSDTKDTGYGIELENELVVLDARLMPFGATKTSWFAEGEILKEPVAAGGMMDRFKGMLTGAPQEFTEQPVIDKQGHVTERVNPLNLYLDYTATHITKQKWHIEAIAVRKEDLVKPRYEQDIVAKLEPTMTIGPEYKNISNSERDRMMERDPDSKGIKIYECHDLENRVIHTVPEGGTDFIEFATEYPIPESSQYAFLWFIEKPNEVYPLPPIKFYRKRANEFSYIYSQVSRQIDKFMPKIGVDGTKLGPIDKEKLKAGNLGTLFETVGAPAGVVSVFNPQVQADLFKYMGMIKELMNMESGVNEYELANPEKRKATEARQISEGTTSRRFKPKKRVAGFLKNQAHKIWMILAQNATEEQMVKVLGPDDAQEWWNDPETGKSTWTKEDIAGDYFFDIDVDSVAPRDLEKQKLHNQESFALLTNPNVQMMMQAEGQQLLIAPVVKKLLKENMEVKDTTTFIKDLNILDPEEEHDQWMYGQYPPVNPKENIQDHAIKHQAWIDSPAFKYLPPPQQGQAMGHFKQTLMLMQQMQAQAQPQSQTQNVPRRTENRTEESEMRSEANAGA